MQTLVTVPEKKELNLLLMFFLEEVSILILK
jgi:hypothetical protein